MYIVHVACISTTNWPFTCTLIDGKGSCMFEVPVSYDMYIIVYTFVEFAELQICMSEI